jgi:hypothetical protein
MQMRKTHLTDQQIKEAFSSAVQAYWPDYTDEKLSPSANADAVRVNWQHCLSACGLVLWPVLRCSRLRSNDQAWVAMVLEAGPETRNSIQTD